MTRFFVRALFFLLGALLVSCDTISPADPRFAAPPQGYDPNPPKDAIVGMWHRATDIGDGSKVVASWLFKPDGSGLVKVKMTGFDTSSVSGIAQEVNDKVYQFTWKYDGGGWWTADMPSASGYANTHPRYRMTADPGSGHRSLYVIDQGNHTRLSRVE